MAFFFSNVFLHRTVTRLYLTHHKLVNAPGKVRDIQQGRIADHAAGGHRGSAC